MTTPSAIDPFSELLLGGAVKLLEMLMEAGYDQARDAYRKFINADEKDLRKAFEKAWFEASTGKYDESLKPLLAHRPFQDAVVTGLLDPIEGFNVEAAREIWQEKYPQYERDLKSFFRNLEKILMRDSHWQPLLKATQDVMESEGVQLYLERTEGDLSVRKVIADMNISDATIQVVEAGGVLIGGNARATIYQTIYMQPSGQPKLSEREFDTYLKDYLAWVEQANSQARLYGIESMAVSKGKPNKHLSDVFLPISMCRFSAFRREEIEEIEKQTNLVEKKRMYLERIRQKQEKGVQVELKDLLMIHNRLAIIGGPGCGKSTLLSYLGLSLARRFSTGMLPFDIAKKENGDDSLLIPILIPLRYYHQYHQDFNNVSINERGQACDGTLRGFIPWYINRYSNCNFPVDFFDRLLRGGGCLLMLDGLDEVVSISERSKVREEVERLVHDQYPQNLVIVTAREAGYQKDAVFSDDFLRLDIQPLSDEQISMLCENWCQQLYPTEVGLRKDELVTAIHKINHRSGERWQEALVRSPLMVSMVISVKYYETELPRERARLYEAVVRVILQAQYLHDDEVRDELISQVGNWEEQREWLSELALAMHQGGKAAAVISEEQLREILHLMMSDQQIERFVQYIRLRGGLFEERAEMFQFTHLSFQEFLTARLLAKHREKAFPTLMEYLEDTWWREVFMLVYGFARMDHPQAAMDYLAWLRMAGVDDEQRLAALELAGAALLDVEKYQPEVIKTVSEELCSALMKQYRNPSPLNRFHAENTLVRLGDPRFDERWYYLPKEDMRGFIRIPVGEFFMGSDPKVDKYADDDEIMHKMSLPEFYIAKYPVTVAQFNEFIKCTGCYDKMEKPNIYNLTNHPVIVMSWKDAVEYCQWLQEKMSSRMDLSAELSDKLNAGWRIILPSEAEWEKAARGVDGRIYPWGNDFDVYQANTVESGIGHTSTVGCFQGGGTPYGLYDMSGNVWEWTRSIYRAYPYQSKDGREKMKTHGEHVLRGGSFIHDHKYSRCACRNEGGLIVRYANFGFRIALVSPSVISDI